jgi:O-antigen/teichoic acid export membrane protein
MNAVFRRRNLLYQAVASGSLAMAELTVSLLCAKALGPDGLGQIAAAISLATVTFALVDLRLQEATVVMSASLLHGNARDELAPVLRRLLYLDILSGVLGFGMVCTLAAAPAILTRSLATSGPLLFTAGAAILLKNVGNAVCRAYLRVRERYAMLAALTAAGAVARVAVLVSIATSAAAAEASDVLLLVLIGNATAGALLVLPTVALAIFRDGMTARSTSIGRETATHLSRFVRGSWLQSLSLVPLREMDIVILAATAGDTAVGIYRLARVGIQTTDALLSPIHLVIFPHIAQLLARGATQALARFLRKLTIYLGLFGGLIAAVGALIAPIVVEATAGASFRSAVPLLQTILVTAPLVAITLWTGPLLVAARATHRAAITTAIAGLLSLIVTGVVATSAGPWGPVAGFVTFTAVHAAASLYAGSRDTTLRAVLAATVRPGN